MGKKFSHPPTPSWGSQAGRFALVSEPEGRGAAGAYFKGLRREFGRKFRRNQAVSDGNGAEMGQIPISFRDPWIRDEISQPKDREGVRLGPGGKPETKNKKLGKSGF